MSNELNSQRPMNEIIDEPQEEFGAEKSNDLEIAINDGEDHVDSDDKKRIADGNIPSGEGDQHKGDIADDPKSQSIEGSSIQMEKPPKGKPRDKPTRRDGNDADMLETQVDGDHAYDLGLGPMRILEPIRTDPVKALNSRQRRLDRLAAVSMPEIHFVGQIVSGLGLVNDANEGACCRWKIDYGKAWQHLGGEIHGQTQMSYFLARGDEQLTFNHPIDVHFAEAGLQGFGAPRIALQSYRMDSFGLRILTGYGFAHLPSLPGYHRLEVSLWRPTGSPDQEMAAYLLGQTPALVSHEPIYETAWRERCRMVTFPAGRVFVELFVVTRHMKAQGIDS